MLAVLTGYHWYDMVSFDIWITELPLFKGYGSAQNLYQFDTLF